MIAVNVVQFLTPKPDPKHAYSDFRRHAQRFVAGDYTITLDNETVTVTCEGCARPTCAHISQVDWWLPFPAPQVPATVEPAPESSLNKKKGAKNVR